MKSEPVEIRVHSVGQCFGCCATVKFDDKVIHETDVYAFGANSVAQAHAEQWADRNGHLTPRGYRALATARVEYSRTVSVAMGHSAADARRVLISEHCRLATAIQAFERHCGVEALENSTIECKRVRAMWERA